jgi:hypothetical protein
MAISVKTLESGKVGSTSFVDLYTVAANKAAIVKNIRLVNFHATDAKTLTLFYLKAGTTAGTGTTVASERRISPVALSVAAGNLYVDNEELTMGAGDKIRILVQTVDIFDYVISGVERDA